MKKLFAILLCIVMMLAMVACGSNEDNNETPNTTQNSDQNNNNTGNGETTIVQPTAEEWEAIDKYRVIMKALNNYTEDGYISVEYSDLGIDSEEETVSGMDALALCYDQLTKLEAMDKWVGTEYVSEDHDRQKTLANFIIVKDVLLKREVVEMDHLGNTTSTYFNEWTYNTDGTVHSAPWDGFESGTSLWRRMLTSQVETNPGQVGISTPQFYVYNTNGQVEKIEYKSDEESTVEAVRNFTYDGNRVVSEKILYADGREETVEYTYDSDAMLIQMEHTTGNPRHRYKHVYTYEYNNQGKVVKETVSEEKEDYNNEGTYEAYATTVLAYTYDSNGHLASAVTTNRYGSGNDFEVRTDNWTYTCSETGRLLNIDISCGNVVWESTGQDTGMNSSVADVKLAFHYGDYYIYNPAK